MIFTSLSIFFLKKMQKIQVKDPKVMPKRDREHLREPMPPKVASEDNRLHPLERFMLIYVDLGFPLGCRFGSKTELLCDELSSSVFMLIYVDFGRIWELIWETCRSPIHICFANV